MSGLWLCWQILTLSYFTMVMNSWTYVQLGIRVIHSYPVMLSLANICNLSWDSDYFVSLFTYFLCSMFTLLVQWHISCDLVNYLCDQVVFLVFKFQMVAVWLNASSVIFWQTINGFPCIMQWKRHAGDNANSNLIRGIWFHKFKIIYLQCWLIFEHLQL